MRSDTTPKGFKFATTAAGFKTPGRQDLALAYSEIEALAAGVFTSNLFKAAPVLVAMENLEACRGEGASAAAKARAVMINTAQANACTGEQGLANCRRTLDLAGRELGLDPAVLLPASTGVIGDQLKMELWEKAVPLLAADLRDPANHKGPEDFARAIMTTDSFPKYTSMALELSGGTVRLAGMAKGAGMICPNMATTLAVLLTDAALDKADAAKWRPMLARATEASFNRATVDGDTSTNDTIFALANGASGVTAKGEELARLENAMTEVLKRLAYMLVQDGEGATKVMHITVKGARDASDAGKAARTVAHSQLVKTAMYGQDANWGRIVAALGRSGAVFLPQEVSVSLCGIEIFRQGSPVVLESEAEIASRLKERDIAMAITLGGGPGEYSMLASDLTHKYVDINADYRS